MTKEEFFKDIIEKNHQVNCMDGFRYQMLVDTYNKALEDAIKAVRLEKASDYGRFSQDPRPTFKQIDTPVIDFTFQGHGDCGYEAVRVSLESIENLKIK